MTADDALAILRGVPPFDRLEPEVLARLAAGENVPPTEYYFRTLMRFQTAAPELAWLTRTLGVGVGQRPPSGPRYDVYAVK